jgi:hypothetical protein
MNNWKKRTKRFVLFIDILGFKDLVARKSHNYVEKKLEVLSNLLESIPNELDFAKISKYQTRAVSFSDSIVVFSRGDSKNDVQKILMDAHHIQYVAFKNQIPIKGSISHGVITVDFKKSIFFGQPIIDAYLLHEEMQILSIVVDHQAEKTINDFKSKLNVDRNLLMYLTPMKCGKVNHKLLRLSDATMEEGVVWLNELYYSVSGKPRVYIDNTLSLYEFIKENKNT